MSEEWRDWVLDSAGALRIGRVICVATAVGACVAVAIVLADLIRGREVTGIHLAGFPFLLVLPVPTVAAGQAWGIAVLIGRRSRAEGKPPKRFYRSTERDPRRFFFDGLPLRQANALLAVAVLGWLAAMTAFPFFSSGTPTAPSRNCPYPLEDHGVYTCVSRSKYLAAGAASQRFAAGILLGFFVIQFGMAAAELARRRRLRNDEGSEPPNASDPLATTGLPG